MTHNTIDDLADSAGAAPPMHSTDASTFSNADFSAMIHGGHVDLTELGAFEVDVASNIASYMIPKTH